MQNEFFLATNWKKKSFELVVKIMKNISNLIFEISLIEKYLQLKLGGKKHMSDV